jgi:hypothetical protein
MLISSMDELKESGPDVLIWRSVIPLPSPMKLPAVKSILPPPVMSPSTVRAEDRS